MKICISTRSRKMSWVLSAICTTSNPAPNMPSVIAVVMVIAMVIVTLRRSPFRTSLNMKLARM